MKRILFIVLLLLLLPACDDYDCCYSTHTESLATGMVLGNILAPRRIYHTYKPYPRPIIKTYTSCPRPVYRSSRCRSAPVSYRPSRIYRPTSTSCYTGKKSCCH